MGMAASQVRLLALTSRKNEIGCELEHLALQETSLTREMQQVTKDYQNALNSKVLKWSNNSGVTYVDLSYANLMRPSSANQNTPYLITNSSGKVVLDSTYAKYAEMISSDGSAVDVSNWEAVRTSVLSSLTGIPEDDITNAESTSTALTEAAEALAEIEAEEPAEPIDDDTATQLFSHVGEIEVDKTSYDIRSLYNVGGWTKLGKDGASAANTLQSILNGVADGLENYFTEDEHSYFREACDQYMSNYKSLFTDTSDETMDSLKSSDGVAGIKFDNKQYQVNMQTILDFVLGYYENATLNAGLESYGENSAGETVYYTRDKESTEWTRWQTEYTAWEEEYNAALEVYETAVDTDNQSLTSDEEALINFYDQLFTAIADNGWTKDSQATDTDYLNNMMQNNLYYITTMKSAEDSDGDEYFKYTSDAASNYDKIYSVNDTDGQNEALVEYEYQKSVINEKESRLDTKRTNLETEQSAIAEMIEGIENVKNENEERTFGIFA